MDLSHELILKGVARTDGLERYIEDKVAKLVTFSDRIQASRVTIEAPSPHHKQGGHYQVTVELTLPGADLIANRGAGDALEHESMHAALRDAFAAARRQLQDYLVRKRQRPGTARAVAEVEVEAVEAMEAMEGINAET